MANGKGGSAALGMLGLGDVQNYAPVWQAKPKQLQTEVHSDKPCFEVSQSKLKMAEITKIW